jgi:hypothetical protein
VRTPEEIADRFARSSVRSDAVSPEHRMHAYGSHLVVIGPEGCAVDDSALATQVHDQEKAERLAAAVAEFLRGVILQAVETALRQCPVPGGLPESRLAEIQGWLDGAADFPVPPGRTVIYPPAPPGSLPDPCVALPGARTRDDVERCLAQAVRDLKGHCDSLHRIMHTPESQAIAQAYEDGRRAERAACVGRVNAYMASRHVGEAYTWKQLTDFILAAMGGG